MDSDLETFLLYYTAFEAGEYGTIYDTMPDWGKPFGLRKMLLVMKEDLGEDGYRRAVDAYLNHRRSKHVV